MSQDNPAKNIFLSRHKIDIIIDVMPHYLDARTNTYYIEFQLMGIRYKRRMPSGMPVKEIAKYEQQWRTSIRNGVDEPRIKAAYHRRSRNCSDGGTVYIFKADRFYKIGRSFNAQARLETVRNSCPFEVICVMSIPVDAPNQIEKELHQRFKQKHVRGEWFALDDVDLHSLRQEYNTR